MYRHIGMPGSLCGPTQARVLAYVGGALSQAADLISGEASAFAISFTGSKFFSATGDYGSARIKDAAVPANDYDSSPFSIVSRSSGAEKMTVGPDGLLKYRKHNKYINSASPGNQVITLVQGATYEIVSTGTVVFTASGAYGGVVMPGTTSFTASTTSLTLTLTVGSGTVHVRRTPCDDTYVETSGSARYGLPFEWVDGVLAGIRPERSRSNEIVHSNDMTDAAWTKTDCTAAKTAVGPSGDANSAVTLTATGANATSTQAITSSSAQRVSGVWLKRRTGTGAIEITQDGSAWTTVAVTASWKRFSLPAATAANPTVGVRISTSGDAVDVGNFQEEVGSHLSTDIETYATTLTRPADYLFVPMSILPAVTGDVTLVASVEPLTPDRTVACALRGTGPTEGYSLQISPTDWRAYCYTNAYIFGNWGEAGSLSKIGVAAATDDAVLYGDGAVIGTDTDGVPPVCDDVLFIGSDGGTPFDGYIKSIEMIPRRLSNSEMAAATAP